MRITPSPSYNCGTCPHYFGEYGEFNSQFGHVISGQGTCHKNPPSSGDSCDFPKTQDTSFCSQHPEAIASMVTMEREILMHICNSLGVRVTQPSDRTFSNKGEKR